MVCPENIDFLVICQLNDMILETTEGRKIFDNIKGKWKDLHKSLTLSRLAGDQLWTQETRGKVSKPLLEGDIVLIRGMAQPREAERLGEVQSIHRTSATVFTRKDSTTRSNRYKLDDLVCLLYTSPSPRDQRGSRMPSSA